MTGVQTCALPISSSIFYFLFPSHDRSISDYDKEKLAERKARLVGGVAVIKVGAATEMEMKNKKYKIEDALNATRATEFLPSRRRIRRHSLSPCIQIPARSSPPG